MDEKEQRILSLTKKVNELERDKQTLLKLLNAQQETITETYKRDAECPFCKDKHYQITEEHLG